MESSGGRPRATNRGLRAGPVGLGLDDCPQSELDEVPSELADEASVIARRQERPIRSQATFDIELSDDEASAHS